MTAVGNKVNVEIASSFPLKEQKMNNYYIYYLNDGESKYIFDRTVPDEKDADNRVQELEKQGKKAIWINNEYIGERK